MLGNDVIDLEDIDARPETFRPRFDERVFSAEERRVIARDAAPLARRWAHWGAKEAAYKLARQFNPNFVFSPIQLTPHFEPAEMISGTSSYAASSSWVERRGRLELPSSCDASASSSAQTQTLELEIRSFETAQSVHVIALPVGSDWDALVFSVEPGSRVDSGSQTTLPAVDAQPSPSSSSSTSAPSAAAAPALDPSGAVRSLAVREIARNLGVDVDRLSIGRCGKIPTVELDGRPTSLPLSLSHHGRFVAFAMTPSLDVSSEIISTDPVMDLVSPKTASE